MSFSLDPTVTDHCQIRIDYLRKAFRIACRQAVIASLLVFLLAFQAHTARLGLYIHPLERALRAAGVTSVPTVSAFVWTGFQPNLAPTMGDLKRRAQAVMQAYAPGSGAVLHATADRTAATVQFTGMKQPGYRFTITAKYERPQQVRLPGSVIVSLEVYGTQADELRSLDERLRKAVQRGALRPWSSVETWLTLSGTTPAASSGQNTVTKAFVAGGGVLNHMQTKTENGTLSQHGFSPCLAPAWRLGEVISNIEVSVKAVSNAKGKVLVQVGSPFVMPKQGTAGTLIDLR